MLAYQDLPGTLKLGSAMSDFAEQVPASFHCADLNLAGAAETRVANDRFGFRPDWPS